MKIRFSDAAEAEIEDAIDYYKAEQTSLAVEFLDELNHAIERIKQFPEAWTPVSSRARRCPLRRFPYSVIYLRRQDTLTIVGVMHDHRDPQVWQKRLSKYKF